MELQEALTKAQLTEQDFTEREAEILLLPEESACDAWIKWFILSVAEMKACMEACTKRNVTNDRKFSRMLLEKSCRGVFGITPNVLRSFGFLTLTEESWLALIAVVAGVPHDEAVAMNEEERDKLGDTEMEATTKTALFLYDKSVLFRRCIVTFSEVVNVLAAEDALRKKRSGTSSDTSA